MNTSYHIAIPEPCSEEWNAMQSQDCGHFCAACQKTVLDFTGFSDAELVAFLRNAKGNVCGRLTRQQLNRPLVAVSRPALAALRPARYLTAGLLATLGITTKIAAWEPQPATTYISPETAAVASVEPVATDTVAKRRITGRVLDNDLEPAPGCSINIPGTQESTVTDTEGNFIILYPEYLITDNKALLYVSSPDGTEDREKFHLKKNNHIKIILPPAYETMVGEMFIARTTFWQRLVQPFRKGRK